MMLITFHIGQERYAQRVNSIVEIIPIINLNKIPLAENYIKGIFNYRGNPTPVIDLCELYTGKSCVEKMSTRIIVTNYEDNDGKEHLLGLIAEKVTESLYMELDEFKTSGIHIEKAPFLSGIAHDENGLIQLIDANRILPQDVEDKLFNLIDEPLAG